MAEATATADRSLDDVRDDPQPGDCIRVPNGHQFVVTSVDGDSVQATETGSDGRERERDIPRDEVPPYAVGSWEWVVDFFAQYGGTVCSA